MSEYSINLNKLLQLFALPDGKMRGKVRPDVQNFIAKEKGQKEEGGHHFHLPFWRDLKFHIAGHGDLEQMTKDRIAQSPVYRARLYRLLCDSALEWLRGLNEKVSLAAIKVKGTYIPADFETKIKVHTFLSLKTGSGAIRSLYPYFSDEPGLTEEMARLGLWIMKKALPDTPEDQLFIYDILRKKTYSLQDTAFLGNEEALFEHHMVRVQLMWDSLYTELSTNAA